jgi:sec-independent protein translocase protein TatA
MIENMHNCLAMWMPSGGEWIIILVIAVLIFGRRLPEIARGMGKSLTEFKKGVREAQDEVTNTIDEDISPIEEAIAEDSENS